MSDLRELYQGDPRSQQESRGTSGCLTDQQGGGYNHSAAATTIFLDVDGDTIRDVSFVGSEFARSQGFGLGHERR